MRRQGPVSFLVGTLFSAACLWYALRGVDLLAMARGIGRVDVLWILGSVLAGLLSLVIRAIRWRLLLTSIIPAATASLVSATFIGMMANNLLPARLGEVVRAWVLARRVQASVPTVLASIVVERLLDVVALLVVLGVCLAAVSGLDGGAAGLMKRTGLTALLGVVVGISGLVVVVRFRESLLRAWERWATRLDLTWAPRALDLRGFVEGLSVLRGVVQVASVIGLSFLVWAAAIASFQILAEGFNLGLTPVQTALVFVIVLFGMAIPSAPGYVGTFHGFCVAGLAMVAGTEPTLAAAYSTLLHGSQWLAVTVIGLGCLLANRSVTLSGVLSLTK